MIKVPAFQPPICYSIQEVSSLWSLIMNLIEIFIIFMFKKSGELK